MRSLRFSRWMFALALVMLVLSAGAFWGMYWALYADQHPDAPALIVRIIGWTGRTPVGAAALMAGVVEVCGAVTLASFVAAVLFRFNRARRFIEANK